MEGIEYRPRPPKVRATNLSTRRRHVIRANTVLLLVLVDANAGVGVPLNQLAEHLGPREESCVGLNHW